MAASSGGAFYHIKKPFLCFARENAVLVNVSSRHALCPPVGARKLNAHAFKLDSINSAFHFPSFSPVAR